MDHSKKMGGRSAASASASFLLVDDLEQVLSHGRLWRELDHDLPAAHGDVFLVQGIESLLAFLSYLDQPSIAQDGQVMGNGRLGEAHLFHDLTHRKPAATTLAHDLLAGFIGNGLGEKYRIELRGK